MGRPHKLRRIEFPPKFSSFKPPQIPMTDLEEIQLSVDEYEAIRLADYDDLNHEEAAVKMQISRPTFTRIIESAHKKISIALVEGKAIRIQGGKFEIKRNLCRCDNCGFFWEDDKCELICPECGSKNVSCLGKKFGRRCRHRRCHEGKK